MMELAHSLLLNEEAFKRISETKRPVFIFEWLRFLDKVLVAAQKVRRETGSKILFVSGRRGLQQKLTGLLFKLVVHVSNRLS